jgi:hypothetical protein
LASISFSLISLDFNLIKAIISISSISSKRLP